MLDDLGCNGKTTLFDIHNPNVTIIFLFKTIQTEPSYIFSEFFPGFNGTDLPFQTKLPEVF